MEWKSFDRIEITQLDVKSLVNNSETTLADFSSNLLVTYGINYCTNEYIVFT